MRATLPLPLRTLPALAAVLLALAPLGAVPAVADEDAYRYPPALSAAELDQLVAPVALYPDVVLDSLLPAAVYPGDVAVAARYVASHGGIVDAAPAGTQWDVGLVALLQFPDVLRWMGENPLWVERMGFAVAIQQDDVLAAIQRYRARALAAGILDSNQYVLVRSGPEIVIYSVSPRVVYVPVYDPWALDSWQRGRTFYNSWFSYSFGALGYWGSYRIFWGTGIYGYAEPVWWGRYRSPAQDWGTGRPARWSAARRTDQPWTRTGWTTTAWRTSLRAPSTRTSATPVAVSVALPPSGRSRGTGSRAPALREPTGPAAPVTRWTRTPRTTPRVPVQPTAVRQVPPQARRTVQPPDLRPAPRAIQRAPIDRWSRRGNGSLERGTRERPDAPTTQPARRTPQQQPAPRVREPEIRAFPPPRRAEEPLPNGRRVRVHDRRGHEVLGA